MSEQITTISAQIPIHLAQGLAKICEREERSKSYYVKKALELLLKEELEVLEDIEDYQEAKKAYEEFKKSKQKAIPYEKVFKKLNKK